MEEKVIIMGIRKVVLAFIIVTNVCWCSLAFENLVTNPGFEEWTDSLENWGISSAEPNAVTRSTDSYTGKYAVKIAHQKNSSYSYVKQAIDVKPNTFYDASVMVRGENIKASMGGHACKLFIGKYPAANTLTASHTINGTFDWCRLFSSRFNTGSLTKIWVYVYLHQASGNLWIDDLLLFEVDDNTEEQLAILRQKSRLIADLKQVESNLSILEQKKGASATTELKQELDIIKGAVDQHSLVDSFDYTKNPPYNDLHRAMYRINGKVLAKLYEGKEYIIWSGGKWNFLRQLQLPESEKKVCLQEDLMLNQWGNTAFNITNTTSSQQTFSLKLGNFLDGNAVFPQENLVLREVTFVESITSQMQPDALRRIEKSKGDQYLVTIPAGATAQVWLQMNGKGFQQAGTYDGIITISNGKQTDKVYLTLKFWPLTFPEDITLHGYNWSYLNWPILEGKEEEAVRDLLAHYTDTFIIHHPYLPWPVVDDEGNIISMDFSEFDQQLEYHRGARMFLLWFMFESPLLRRMKTSFEFMSPQWENVFAQWINAIVSHLEAKGITKTQFAFYPVDEPSFSPNEKHQILITTARKIKSIDSQLLVFTDPIGSYDAGGLANISQVVDIICTQLGVLTPELSRALQATGRTIWTYQCGGPGKDLSPIGYYRLQAWGAWLNGCKGSGFWSYADTGWPESTFGKSAWDDFDGKNADYAIIYESPEELVSSKRWEAWRDGIEDYEYLVMMEKELERLAGSLNPHVRIARAFLEEMPQQVFDSGDPALIQEARLTILELLIKLKNLE
jgi:hypothetical protein